MTGPCLPFARAQDMSEGGGCGHVLVKARFPFLQTNEDELSFSKGDIISVSRQEEGGWWEGSLNDRTGWFPSNYVRELKGSGGCSLRSSPDVVFFFQGAVPRRQLVALPLRSPPVCFQAARVP